MPRNDDGQLARALLTVAATVALTMATWGVTATLARLTRLEMRQFEAQARLSRLEAQVHVLEGRRQP